LKKMEAIIRIANGLDEYIVDKYSQAHVRKFTNNKRS
jgi:hypothetical protein